MPEAVQSVVQARDNGRLLAVASQLWIAPDDLVVDVTYGRGNFWTRCRPVSLVAHDLAVDGVDFRHLPELDGSVDVVVFDPPYIAQGGRDTSTIPDMLSRYGLVDGPKSVAESRELIAAGITEAVRVLAPRGRLLVKCMDYVNGGRLVLARHHVVCTALGAGLDQVDEFVHYSGLGPQPGGQAPTALTPGAQLPVCIPSPSWWRRERTKKGKSMTDIEPQPRDDVADPEALGESEADDGTPGATKAGGRMMDRHPGTTHLLKFFEYGHLPELLQGVSRPCCVLADEMADALPDGPELTAGLRKLLEAKDCFVRAALP